LPSNSFASSSPTAAATSTASNQLAFSQARINGSGNPRFSDKRRFLRGFFVCDLIWCILFTVWIILMLSIKSDFLSGKNLCKEPPFMLLRLGVLALSIVFAIMGGIIGQNLKK